MVSAADRYSGTEAAAAVTAEAVQAKWVVGCSALHLLLVVKLFKSRGLLFRAPPPYPSNYTNIIAHE